MDVTENWPFFCFQALARFLSAIKVFQDGGYDTGSVELQTAVFIYTFLM
jgi:hypothetical protein